MSLPGCPVEAVAVRVGLTSAVNLRRRFRTVSRHLAVLRRAGLLTARRQGRYIRYTLNLPDLAELGTDLLAVVLR
ncbi:hypothetical protein A6A06_15535 [Streptomyces sp. CB02923]|nr:hypothetical protein A6A06_15535 [Streptomyces sp. CB02923]